MGYDYVCCGCCRDNQKHVFLTALGKFWTNVFSDCFVFDGERFQHLAKFSDYGHNR